jgi:hypothetical protein
MARGSDRRRGRSTGQIFRRKPTQPAALRHDRDPLNTSGGRFVLEEDDLPPPEAPLVPTTCLQRRVTPSQSAQYPPPPSRCIPADPCSHPFGPDQAGAPLPRRVDEVDIGATSVTRWLLAPASALQPSPGSAYAAGYPPYSPAYPPAYRPPASSASWQRGLGCLLRLVVVGLFLMVVVALLGFLSWCSSITALPPPCPR